MTRGCAVTNASAAAVIVERDRKERWGGTQVGFLRRLRGGGQKRETWPPSGPITTWPGDSVELDVAAYMFEPTGRARLDVVGEGSYQGTLERIGGGKTIDGMRIRDHTAILLPEPSNPYDPNAVKVVIITGPSAGRVGYLSRENAVAYRPIIDRLAALGKVAACRASLQGGWDRGSDDRGSIGVVLRLGTPEDCSTEMIDTPPTPAWEDA
jgi:hypothetical protein